MGDSSSSSLGAWWWRWWAWFGVCRRCRSVVNANEALLSLIYSLCIPRHQLYLLLSHSLPHCLSSHLSQGPEGTHTLLHLCLNHDNKVHLALSCHALLHYRHADYLGEIPDSDHADHEWFLTQCPTRLHYSIVPKQASR